MIWIKDTFDLSEWISTSRQMPDTQIIVPFILTANAFSRELDSDEYVPLKTNTHWLEYMTDDDYRSGGIPLALRRPAAPLSHQDKSSWMSLPIINGLRYNYRDVVCYQAVCERKPGRLGILHLHRGVLWTMV